MGFRDLFKTADQLAEKILNEFNGVERLDEVIKGILNLKDSEIYGKVYETTKTKEGKLGGNETVEDLLEFSQVKYATKVLKEVPIYLPPLTDVIVSSHFIATVSMIDFITYAYKQADLSQKDLNKNHSILERLMSLLDDFDKPGEFQKPDKEFYQKLKKIKWNKEGKKLYNELGSIRIAVRVDKWGTDSSTFGTGEGFTLTFLAACNAVHHDRDRILKEDMIKAYKTYLKLLDTDISKLEV